MCCVPINWKPFHVLCVCAAFVSLKCCRTTRRRDTETSFQSQWEKTKEVCLNDFYKSIESFEQKQFLFRYWLRCKGAFHSPENERQHCNEWKMKKAHKCNWRVWFLIFLFITLRIVLLVDGSLFRFSFSTSLCVSACLCISAREATPLFALGRRQAEHIS